MKEEKKEWEDLSLKQKRFCEEYAKSLDGKQSYTKAGYTGKNPEQSARNLLTNPKVYAYITHLLRVSRESSGVSTQRILQELAAIAFSDIRNIVDFDNNSITIKNSTKLAPEVAASIQQVKMSPGEYGNIVSFKLHPKTQALQMLMRYFGMYDDFNSAIATLSIKYGIKLYKDEVGKWKVEERNN